MPVVNYPDPSSTIRRSRLSAHLEARERLLYLAQRCEHGLLSGRTGTGKTRVLSELRGELSLQGVATEHIDMTGLQVQELAAIIAGRLGLSSGSQLSRAWAELDDYFSASRQMDRPFALFLDHVDRCDSGVVPELDRLLSMSVGSVSCLMAVTSPSRRDLLRMLGRYCGLRIELPLLDIVATGEVLAGESPVGIDGERRTRLSTAGQEELYRLSGGRLRSIGRIQRLAEVALQADQLEIIDEHDVLQLVSEIRR